MSVCIWLQIWTLFKPQYEYHRKESPMYKLFHGFFSSGVGLNLLGTAPTSGLLYKPQVIDEGDCGAMWNVECGMWNEDWQGKLKYSEITCPSATLSTTNPT
jgi:hypothetical protein